MRSTKIILGVFFAGGHCISAALAQPNETTTTIINPPVQAAPVPRLGAPKAQIEFDLRAFFTAINESKNEGILNNERIGAHISGARVGFFGAQEWTNYFVASRGKARF